MLKAGILGILMLANGVALFCALNPWLESWRDQGHLFFLFEAAFLVLVGVPVLIYQMVWKGKSFRQSLSDSVQVVLDFLSHFV